MTTEQNIPTFKLVLGELVFILYQIFILTRHLHFFHRFRLHLHNRLILLLRRFCTLGCIAVGDGGTGKTTFVKVCFQSWLS